ncbi:MULTISPECIES: hypothetical protein [Geobacillus]|jgi:hypothetical protein|uniref:Uncharacterized protein n=1 Tax=Geobacillus thermodenitrificans TaxID=33940 RepID=A0ABY9QFG8_GEOTD|nr:MULTISPECIES: hypothetical protein [Geobacillus]MEC5186344.1 hypothetical protein [Geobacillus thermodenitrificans]MED3717877.1 hypothetical protein [Geobacillus thermodenitrificans]MED3904935.1 hypothetical protein [Geobacillus thermodenitrificans]MED4916948.1 hypothetical protein [Geobacillus thermodenitrificans]QNU31078.1 hypothetical protein IC804_17140 [Geobacillus sp. 47C-IIb]
MLHYDNNKKGEGRAEQIVIDLPPIEQQLKKIDAGLKMIQFDVDKKYVIP